MEGYGVKISDIQTLVFYQDKVRVDIVDYFNIVTNEISYDNIKMVTYKKPSLFGNGSIQFELVTPDSSLHRFATFMLVAKSKKFEAEQIISQFSSCGVNVSVK